MKCIWWLQSGNLTVQERLYAHRIKLKTFKGYRTKSCVLFYYSQRTKNTQMCTKTSLFQPRILTKVPKNAIVRLAQAVAHVGQAGLRFFYYKSKGLVYRMNKKMTIGDIAEALGVSKTTVSRTISGKGRISAETKEKIMKFIEEHEYVPNALAKGLAKSRTYNLGITVPEDFAISDLPFFQKCLMGVCERACEADYDVVVSMTAGNDISQLERMVSNRKVDGVILTRTFTKDLPAEYLKSRGIPFVAIGSSLDGSIVSVDHDHERACEELTQLVLRQRRGKVALLCGNMTHMVSRSRLRGFVNALKKSGIAVTDDMIWYGADTAEAEAVIEKAVRLKPACILCMDDSICLRVLDFLKRENLKVPEDVRVASFYSSSILDRNVPGITSLRFDDKELGRNACETLLKLIDGEDVPKKTLRGYEVALNESTATEEG